MSRWYISSNDFKKFLEEWLRSAQTIGYISVENSMQFFSFQLLSTTGSSLLWAEWLLGKWDSRAYHEPGPKRKESMVCRSRHLWSEKASGPCLQWLVCRNDVGHRLEESRRISPYGVSGIEGLWFQAPHQILRENFSHFWFRLTPVKCRLITSQIS